MCSAMYISHYTDLINLMKFTEIVYFVVITQFQNLLFRQVLEFQGGAEIKAWLLFATSATLISMLPRSSAAAINISFFL